MTKVEIFNVVKDYLTNTEVTYGTAISSIDVLANAGIHAKKINKEKLTAEEEALNAYYQDDYVKLGVEVAELMMEHLREFGFASDRVHRPDHNSVVVRVNGCTVYTRYPWDAYYKARKSVQLAERNMDLIHDTQVDMTLLKKIAQDIYAKGSTFTKIKRDRATELKSNNKIMWEAFDSFHKLLNSKKAILVEKFKKLQPVNYGNYENIIVDGGVSDV